MINISNDEGSPVASDGEEPVSAVKSCTRTAAQLAGINIVNGRCARFAQKYAGLTPKQTLGTHHAHLAFLRAFVCPHVADMFMQPSFLKGGALGCTIISTLRRSSPEPTVPSCTGSPARSECITVCARLTHRFVHRMCIDTLASTSIEWSIKIRRATSRVTSKDATPKRLRRPR